jgi:ssDNA thymidine ADP-ribosyltransferase, DarT
MVVPIPTPIYRLAHIDNLEVLLRRGGLHAPKHTPKDGLPYRTIHNVEIQMERRVWPIPCGPKGTIHDYVSFYFGPRSPMLFQLRTGWVPGYAEGQDPLIYLMSSAQKILAANIPFVFSDGHGIAAYTHWYDSLDDLERIDWQAVYARIWKSDLNDMDRQRRKQAEFLVHRFCPWPAIEEIGVLNGTVKDKVERILARFGVSLHRTVTIKPDWYY